MAGYVYSETPETPNACDPGWLVRRPGTRSLLRTHPKVIWKGLRPLWGWSGGAMVLGKLPVLERPTTWITVGPGPAALVVGAGEGCLDIFTLIYPFLSSFSLSLGDGPI